MKEKEIETRDGKVNTKEGEIKVLIIDNGENLNPEGKSIPNHDKVIIIYPDIQK